MKIKIKRIYEKADKEDGFRILVDRLWPRGFTKENAAVDLWLKEIAPTTELRKWFNHMPERWAGFKKQYRSEIQSNKEPLSQLKEYLQKGNITLVYAAKDEKHNAALVLLEELKKSKNYKMAFLAGSLR